MRPIVNKNVLRFTCLIVHVSCNYRSSLSRARLFYKCSATFFAKKIVALDVLKTF